MRLGRLLRIALHRVGELADGRRWVWVVGSPVRVQLDLCSVGVLHFLFLMLKGGEWSIGNPIDDA